MWRKEINLFCVSSVVVFISDLAFCKKIYQKYCIFVNLFSPQKKLRYFFKFSHENEIYKKIVKSPPAHCSETVKSRLPCIWFFMKTLSFLVAQEQTWGVRGHWAMLEQSPITGCTIYWFLTTSHMVISECLWRYQTTSHNTSFRIETHFSCFFLCPLLFYSL